MQKIAQWQWYQARVADLFRRIEGAEVYEDYHEDGVNVPNRQIDVLARFPMRIAVGSFVIEVPIKVIVDTKHWATRVDVKALGEVAELKEDVQANMAIVVSSKGATKGARDRAASLGIYLVTVTTDLFVLLAGVSREVSCCYSEDAWHEVSWDSPDRVTGHCDYCGSLHIRCPDCLAVFGAENGGGSVACPECEAVYSPEYDRKGIYTGTEVYDALEVQMLKAAYQRSLAVYRRGRFGASLTLVGGNIGNPHRL
jgi:restriction endonuclease